MANFNIKNIKKEHIIWIVGILFFMSIYPGQGTKAVDQQAIVVTDNMCAVDTDCPVCVGGFAKLNDTVKEDELTFFQELSYAKCVSGKCRLSEYCLVWDCGKSAGCDSVKQTLLDNTLSRLNENPALTLGIVALVVALLLL